MFQLPQMTAQMSFSLLLHRARGRFPGFILPEIEHVAIPQSSIVYPRILFTQLGYENHEQSPAVTFFGKQGCTTIEVVPNTTPSHVGYLFKTRSHLMEVCELICEDRREWGDPQHVVRDETLHAVMFMYQGTGDHFQLIWRSKPLFVWGDG